MQIRGIIICLLSFYLSFASAQNSISFYSNTELSNLLKIAQQQDKNVFIDTYAKWCKPCKKQDKTFMDDKVAAYFNSNFINVKYDMDTEIGKAVDLKYGVVFLPTVLILDKYGNVRIKVDNGVLSPKELLNIAKAVTEPALATTQTTEPIPKSNEVVKETATEPTPSLELVEKKVPNTGTVKSNPEEKILYVLDNDSELPPEVLLEEAYFRMELMDGTHREAAKKYLLTQEDWSTDKNVKFVHDFLHTTRSEEFKYLIDNRERFSSVIGEENVKNTIEHLVYNTLYNGYPRPTLEKAIELFSHIDPHNNTVNGHKYFLTRLHEEENKAKYCEFAKRYLSKKNKKDHAEMKRLAETLILETPDKEQINESEKWIKKAIKLQDNNPSYFEQFAKISYLKKDRAKAFEALQKAIELTEGQERESTRLQELLETWKTE